MTSSIFAFCLILCSSLALSTDGSPTQTRSVRDLSSNNNNLRKAIDQQQKLELELAMEKTRLEELNNIKKIEGIEDTPSFNLLKWQKSLLSDIRKTENKILKLTAKAASSTSLVENLTASSTSPVTDEKLIYERTRKVLKALEEQQKINTNLVIEMTKLEELEKQKETEQISDNAVLTKLQQHILHDINKAKENIIDLTVETGVINTAIDVLKKQLVAVGGSLDKNDFTSYKNVNEINAKIQKAQKNQQEINMKLARATQKLELLENQKNAANINDQNKLYLTKKQKKLLKEFEEAKEKKYELTLKATLVEALIEHLKLLLTSDGSANDISYSTSQFAGWKF